MARALLRSDLRSPLWLIGAYALLAVAERFLFVAGDRAFGAWYGSIGLSMFGGSLLTLGWDRISASSYFALLALAMIANAALMARVAGRLDALLSRFGREVPPRSLSASPLLGAAEGTDTPTASLVTSLNLPSVRPRRLGLVLATGAILLALSPIILKCVPLPVRAENAFFCGLALLLRGSHLVARLVVPRSDPPNLALLTRIG